MRGYPSRLTLASRQRPVDHTVVGCGTPSLLGRLRLSRLLAKLVDLRLVVVDLLLVGGIGLGLLELREEGGKLIVRLLPEFVRKLARTGIELLQKVGDGVVEMRRA
ncbi:MAG: hypothetical protein KGL39_43680 [Patescibacteria group bacterium]|nr:hypothetical protein [Patescibacteria group bacterium]